MLFSKVILGAGVVLAAALSPTLDSHHHFGSIVAAPAPAATDCKPGFAGIDPKAAFTETPDFTFDQLYDLTTRFFDAFMFPNNTIEAAKINSTLFSENVRGRVDATRDFNGRELNTEYAFGLFSNIALNPKSFTLLGIPQSYIMTHLTANQNIASAAVIINFNITALSVVNPVEVDLRMTYNSRGEVSQYDASFRWLQWQFDELAAHAKKMLNFNTTAEVSKLSTNLLAGSVCDTAQTYCNGTNAQYKTKDECVNFLTNEVPFGSAYQLGMNTLTCRMVHQGMVPLRPDVHCPHLGRSGGGYCTDDRTYAATVREKLFNITAFVPYGRQLKNGESEE